MDELQVTAAAFAACTAWLTSRHRPLALLTRPECRTEDGLGRADGLVAAALDDGAILVVAIESKSRFGRMELLPHLDSSDLAAAAARDPLRSTTEAEVARWVASHARSPAVRQLERYPADFSVLAIPEHVLDDLDLDLAVVDQQCRAADVGLLAVGYHGHWQWRVQPRPRPRPPLTIDMLEPYAAGPQIRAALAAAIVAQSRAD